MFLCSHTNLHFHFVLMGRDCFDKHPFLGVCSANDIGAGALVSCKPEVDSAYMAHMVANSAYMAPWQKSGNNCPTYNISAHTGRITEIHWSVAKLTTT